MMLLLSNGGTTCASRDCSFKPTSEPTVALALIRRHAVAMCTRYIARGRTSEMARLFDARLSAADIVLDEMFPGRDGAVIGRGVDGARGLALMRWGWPPPSGARAPVVNVRNLSSPFWRAALSDPRRRCLVPFNRFCEWGAEPSASGKKVAHWFALSNRPVAAFAGIWCTVPGESADTPPLRAYAFLTCAPNALVGAVHPKAMPVILDPADYDRWLDAPVDQAVALARPIASDLMTMID